jgi:hypothetical protein
VSLQQRSCHVNVSLVYKPLFFRFFFILKILERVDIIISQSQKKKKDLERDDINDVEQNELEVDEVVEQELAFQALSGPKNAFRIFVNERVASQQLCSTLRPLRSALKAPSVCAH